MSPAPAEPASSHTGVVRPEQVTGLVLCGGASRRMGRDKARLRVDGQTLLGRTIGLLAPRTLAQRLACGAASRYPELGLPEDLDRVADAGPLAGLEASLAQTRTPWALVVPCDLARLGAEALDGLLAAARPGDALVHWRSAGRDQPLCALVSVGCLPAIRAALDGGARKLVSWWDRVEARSLEAPPAVATQLAGVNTPEELAALGIDLATTSTGGLR